MGHWKRVPDSEEDQFTEHVLTDDRKKICPIFSVHAALCAKYVRARVR